ncbi:MAG: GHKL domain-containing protein, partial [Lentisphaeria bacterium]|nr:GHKL domain-containing protein [Lentisphaeria bacterium]
KPLPKIRATPTQIVQVFQNIIGNALKFCREDIPRVAIWAERDADSWIFRLRDNGIGIDDDVQDRVFMLFQRLHTREEYEGTGIGLATCKKIIEQHGGRIWIESSSPSEGTTFAFSIPMAGEERDDPSDESKVTHEE